MGLVALLRDLIVGECVNDEIFFDLKTLNYVYIITNREDGIS